MERKIRVRPSRRSGGAAAGTVRSEGPGRLQSGMPMPSPSLSSSPSSGVTLDISIKAAVSEATQDLVTKIEGMANVNRLLTTKLADLESKVKDLSGRLYRQQLRRKAQRIQRTKERERALRTARNRSRGIDTSEKVNSKPVNKDRDQKMTPNKELRGILLHPKGFTSFQKFCVTEDCGENPIFWRKCNEFIDECECTLEDIALLETAGLDPSELFLPHIPTDPSLQVAKTIFFDFIVQGSHQEVSLSKGLVQKLTKGIHKLLRTQNKSTLLEMLHYLRDAQAEVFAFMVNYTFRRFVESEAYAEFRTTHPLVQQTSKERERNENTSSFFGMLKQFERATLGTR